MTKEVLESLELIKDFGISDILETSIQDWLKTSNSRGTGRRCSQSYSLAQV
jgi:hypothetical protein